MHPYMYDQNGNLLPWYRKPPIEPTWVEQFEKDFEKRWKEAGENAKRILWNTPSNEEFQKLKQQHMIFITSENEQLISAFASAMYGTVDAGTYASAKKLAKQIEDQGFTFYENRKLDRPAQGYDNREPNIQACLNPDQTTGAAYAKTGKVYTSSESTVKSFIMIDINAVEKQFTVDEVIRIFEQTGISIIRKKRNLTWGEAIKYLKDGKKLARTGWNGTGMYVYYVPANTYPSVTDIAKEQFGTHTRYEAYFALKNTKNTVNTWVPSVSDNLAEDWYVVE